MFTDDPDLVAEGWQVRVVSLPGHPRMAAKRFKLMPSVYVPEYEFRVWMGASHRLVSPTAVQESMGSLQNGMAMHKHPGRDCVYQEALASLPMEKYKREPISAQVRAYREQGHPEHWGLWACGTIASTPEADPIFADWWREITTWSYQDQISLPVVCRRRGVRPGTFPHPQTPSPWFMVGGHTRND
jgi:hypothetical protein